MELISSQSVIEKGKEDNNEDISNSVISSNGNEKDSRNQHDKVQFCGKESEDVLLEENQPDNEGNHQDKNNRQLFKPASCTEVNSSSPGACAALLKHALKGILVGKSTSGPFLVFR